jgi:hypothetical protein
MKPNKKPRADSILDSQLSEAQKEELRVMLMSGTSYALCMEWLSFSCGVVVKSGDTLSTFWKRHCAPIVDEQRRFSAVRAEAYGDSIKALPVDWVSKILERIKQISFELMINPSPDSAQVKELVDSLVKLDKQALDREKFKEALTKAKAAVKVANDTALTDEQKAAELKRIFRMG